MISLSLVYFKKSLFRFCNVFMRMNSEHLFSEDLLRVNSSGQGEKGKRGLERKAWMGLLNLLNVSGQYFQSSLGFTHGVLCKPLSCTHGLQDCCGETEWESGPFVSFLFPPFPYKSVSMSFKNNIHFPTCNCLYVCVWVQVCAHECPCCRSQEYGAPSSQGSPIVRNSGELPTVNAGNQIQCPCKSSTCPWPLSHLSRPPVLVSSLEANLESCVNVFLLIPIIIIIKTLLQNVCGVTRKCCFLFRSEGRLNRRFIPSGVGSACLRLEGTSVLKGKAEQQRPGITSRCASPLQ